MKKLELKQLIKEVISEDIFLQNRKSPEEKSKRLKQELELDYKTKFKSVFSVDIYEGDLILTKELLLYFTLYSKIKIVTGDFDCINLQLKSLVDLPIPNEVKGDFSCFNNKLTTLEGSPNKIKGSFYCNNNELISLKGVPKEIGENFDCSNNKFTTLEGAPKRIGGDFVCISKIATFAEADVRKVCDVGGGVYIK